MLMSSALAIFNGVLHAKLSKAPHNEITRSVNSVFSRGGHADFFFESAIAIPQLEGSTSAIAIPQFFKEM
jgi:hypothetical protein